MKKTKQKNTNKNDIQTSTKKDINEDIKKAKVKSTLTNILKKLPVFLFCVAFINDYNFLCGVDNSIVGVVLLMGLLILISADLSYDVKYATPSIFVLFVILAFMPKISLINMWLGLLVNLFSLTLIMVLSAHDTSKTGYLPFAMGYIMLQGYDVTGVVYEKRWISIIVGGGIISLIYYLVHKKKSNNKNIKNLVNEISIYDDRTQWYIRMIVTLTIVMFVGQAVSFKKTMWISLTVLSLTTPVLEEFKSRIVRRIPATIIGSVGVFVLFELLVPNKFQTAFILLAGFLSMFITSYFIKTIYNSFSALITATLLFPTDMAVNLRIIANLVGAGVVLISTILFNQLFKLIVNK